MIRRKRIDSFVYSEFRDTWMFAALRKSPYHFNMVTVDGPNSCMHAYTREYKPQPMISSVEESFLPVLQALKSIPLQTVSNASSESEERRKYCNASSRVAPRVSVVESLGHLCVVSPESTRSNDQRSCRRHAPSPSQFYRWRVVAQSGSTDALKQEAKRKRPKDDTAARQEPRLRGCARRSPRSRRR